MNPIKFNMTVLRDGHQSLAATRMKTAQMVPIAGRLDDMGYNVLETWGGATIDSCLRYLKENPFDRLDTLKKLTPKTPHSMLLRGQNLLQYTNFPDDVVDAFVAVSAKHGMDIFRIFDALNDVRNTERAIAAVLKAGKHAQGAISYTTSPVHTLDSFVELGKNFVRLGCQSLCIKDMAGLITPDIVSVLVKRLKTEVNVPIFLHSHNTAGLAVGSYLAAAQAGIDGIDVSIAPFANGTGQPDAALMLSVLNGVRELPELDINELYSLTQYLKGTYNELKEFTSPSNERIDVDILRYQIPGGMMSNFVNQLKEQGISDKLDEVMQEVPRVREALGWIPLVTPTSQIVGNQAMLNVKFGKWKMLSQPAMDIALGKYGKTPGPIDPEVLKLSIEKSGKQPIEGRPADHMAPRMETLRAECKAKGLPETDEIVTLYAMFPQQVVEMLKPAPVASSSQSTQSPKVASTPTPSSAQSSGQVLAKPQEKVALSGSTSKSKMEFNLTINGTSHQIKVEEF